jgi:hypothetical protein
LAEIKALELWCARCGRKLKYPVFIGNDSFGRICAKIIGKRRQSDNLPLPCQVDVKPEFFGDTIQITESDITEHVESLEIPLVKSLKISFEPIDYQGDESVVGTYDPTNQEISFYPSTKSLSHEESLEILTHEYGHAIWHQALTEDGKQFWENVYGELRQSGRFITGYASTNVHELFAESFLAYVHKPGLLKLVNKRCYEWLRSNVFGGREFL